jgi:hypothetical protein
MKTIIALYILLIVVSIGSLRADLLDVYKRGVIKINPDSMFGSKTDWESLMYDDKKDLQVTPYGDSFVSNYNTNNFYKFSKTGDLLGTFGRVGSGPGDLYQCSLKSTFNGKYLVLGDHSSSRKISLFDFAGKYFSCFRTKDVCFNPVGLKDGAVAYYSVKNNAEIKDGKWTNTIDIHIMKIHNREELVFTLGSYLQFVITMSSTYSVSPGSYFGNVTMQQTLDGNLLVGLSNILDLKIYAPDGKLLRSFKLKIQLLLVTDTYIKNEAKAMIDSISHEQIPKELFKKIKKAIESSDFSQFFGKYLPYYKSFTVDAEGNIVVFKWPEAVGKTNEKIQVYKPDGTYICETILDEGAFDFINYNSIQFTKAGLYGIVKYDDAEGETIYRLIKVSY